MRLLKQHVQPSDGYFLHRCDDCKGPKIQPKKSQLAKWDIWLGKNSFFGSYCEKHTVKRIERLVIGSIRLRSDLALYAHKFILQ